MVAEHRGPRPEPCSHVQGGLEVIQAFSIRCLVVPNRDPDSSFFPRSCAGCISELLFSHPMGPKPCPPHLMPATSRRLRRVGCSSLGGPLSGPGLRFSDAPGNPNPGPQETQCRGFYRRLGKQRSGLPCALGTCGFLPPAQCAEPGSRRPAAPERSSARIAARETSSSFPPGTRTKHPLQIRSRGTEKSETLGRTEEKPGKRLQSEWNNYSARARAGAGDAAGRRDALEARSIWAQSRSFSSLHLQPPNSLAGLVCVLGGGG